MSDLFDLLISRVTGDRPMVEPRLPGMFESPGEAVLEPEGFLEETGEVVASPMPKARPQTPRPMPKIAAPHVPEPVEPPVPFIAEETSEIQAPASVPDQVVPMPTESSAEIVQEEPAIRFDPPPRPEVRSEAVEAVEPIEWETIVHEPAEPARERVARIVVDRTVRTQPVAPKPAVSPKREEPVTFPMSEIEPEVVRETAPDPAVVRETVLEELLREIRVPTEGPALETSAPGVAATFSIHQTVNSPAVLLPPEPAEAPVKPTVNVTIGRVDIVTAPRKEPIVPPPAARPRRESALEQHLRKRDGESR